MNLKFFRYFVVLFLLLGSLILSSNYVNGLEEITANREGCYIKGLDCQTENLCIKYISTATDICVYNATIPYDDCWAGTNNNNYGMDQACQQVCCCDRTNSDGSIGGRQLLRGVCTSPNFFPEVFTTNVCNQKCKERGIGPATTWNITGHVTVNEQKISGVEIIFSNNKEITNSNGDYELRNVPEGTYTINYKYNTCNEWATNVLINSNITKDVALSCNTYDISGIITDINGEPVSKADIQYTNAGNTQIIQSNSDGIYILNEILEGSTVDIIANKSTCIGSLHILNIDENKENQDITISCNKYNISGKVFDDNKTPVKWATVIVSNKRGTTNENGYYFISEVPETLDNNQLTISASFSETINSKTTRTCNNKKEISLKNNAPNTDIDMKCCINSYTELPCENGIITTTYTSIGEGCIAQEPTTRECTSVLPACQYICDAWTPAGLTQDTCPSGAFSQSRNCIQQKPPSCDIDILVIIPETERACNGQCGDGYLNQTGTPPEECDYDIFSRMLHTTSNSACMTKWTDAGVNWDKLTEDNFVMDYYTAKTICNLNNCSCNIPLEEPEAEVSCVVDPKNISYLNISGIFMTDVFNLTWLMQNENCNDFIENFELRVCNNITGDCVIPPTKVNYSIDKTNRSYIHNDSDLIKPNTPYCYQLTAIYNSSVKRPVGSPNYRTTIITCVNSGDEECMKDHNPNFCLGNEVKNCSKDNNLITEDSCTSNEYCGMNSVTQISSCHEQGPCDKCNSFFGLFSYQGARIPVDTRTLFCPSLAFPNPNPQTLSSMNSDDLYGCYIDYSLTSIDKAYSCTDTESCYDYLSESSCTNDYCGKFTSSPCEWANYTIDGKANIFKKGICRPKDEMQQNCSMCDNKENNRLYVSCTADVCINYGQCYFNLGTEKCMNQKDVKCTDYYTSAECIGSNSQNSSTNVDWFTGYQKHYKYNGTNTLIPSNDSIKLGVCKWISDDLLEYFGYQCVRDADNDTLGEYKSGIVDCIIRDDKLKSVCNRDIIPPNTTISNSTIYGLIIDLNSQISIVDKIRTNINSPWMIGDETSEGVGSRTQIRTYYCIVSKVSIPCYPNLTLSATSNKNKIDLTKIRNYANNGFINETDNDKLFKMYYFSEDPAKNLEVIESFEFKLDAKKPNVSMTPTKTSFKISRGQWLTNLSIVLKLLESDESGSIECSFELVPEGDDLLKVAFGGKRIYNIPNANTPDTRWLTNVGNTLNTTYPNLAEGTYKYTLICADKVNNLLEDTGSITIDGDLRITSPTPYRKVYRSTPIDGIDSFPGIISINTSAPGNCSYSLNENKLYRDMTVFTDSSNDKYHEQSITSITDSKIYSYYVGCNLSINNQIEEVYGDLSDMPTFAIDDLSPNTTLMYSSGLMESFVTYDNNTVPSVNIITIKFNCSDKNEGLNYSEDQYLSFGCDTTMFCIPKLDKTNNCTNLTEDFEDINDYPDGKILDYSIWDHIDNVDEKTYGNNPTVHFYSIDKGNNTESIQLVRLSLKNEIFDEPELNFTPEATSSSGGIKVLNNSNSTDIIINFTTEITVNTTIEIFKNDSGTITPVDVIDLNENTLFDKSVYEFSRSYFPNGKYFIQVNATDDDDNSRNDTLYFNVAHDAPKVKLESPLMGVGTTPTYTIKLTTDVPSVCKYSTFAAEYCEDFIDSEFNCKYNDNHFNTITSSDDINHIFTYSNTSLKIMHVVCEINDTIGYSDESYEYTKFHVGVMTAPPTINITYIQTPPTNDNIIINPDDLTITIRVVTDNLSVCTINRTDENSYLSLNEFFDDEISIYYFDSYRTNHEITIDYSNKIDYIDGEGYKEEFNYTINCTNLAQWTNDTEKANISINLDDSSSVIKFDLLEEDSNLILSVINISCSDHCTDEYKYKLLHDGSACQETRAWHNKVGLYNETITITENTTICVYAEDILGRETYNNHTYDVMYLDSGNLILNTDYEYVSDNHMTLYSPNRTFVLDVETGDFNSTCKYTKNVNAPVPQEEVVAYIYESHSTIFANTSNSTENMSRHNTTMTIDSAENKEPAETWMIVCKALNVGSEEPYIVKTLFVYYDESKPDVTIEVQPRVYDWNDRDTITIEAYTTDATVCTLNDSIKAFSFTDEEDPLDFYSYRYYHTYIYNVNEMLTEENLSDINFEKNITFNVTCFNRAHLENSTNKTTNYKLDNKIEITQNSENILDNGDVLFKTNNVEINVNTSIKGNCEWFINGTSQGELPTVDRLNHKNTTNLAKGKYSIKVNCSVIEKIADIQSDELEYTLYVDKDEPTVTFNTAPFNQYPPGTYVTCDLTKFNLYVEIEEDTKIENYTYIILKNGASTGTEGSKSKPTDSNSKFTITYPDPIDSNTNFLTPGAKYTVRVTATDIASRSTTASFEITASDPVAGAACDNSKPNITINILNYSGYSDENSEGNIAIVNVTCNDSKTSDEDKNSSSGCISNFQYTFNVGQTDCTGVTYDSSGSKNKKLLFTENGTLCVSWEDEAGNNGNDTKYINITKAECGNGIVETKLSSSELGLSNSAFNDYSNMINEYESLINEQCDNFSGNAPVDRTCLTEGFVGGDLSCDMTIDSCQLNITACDEGMDIELKHPLLFGIGKKSTYDLNVSSEYDATCKYGTPNNAITNIAQAYNLLDKYMTQNTIEGEEYNLHNLSITSTNAGPQYNQKQIICNATNSAGLTDPSKAYGQLRVYEGYDSTNPIITLSTNRETTDTVTNNTVYDWNDRTVEINVQTDDKTICMIKDDIGVFNTNDISMDDSELEEYNKYKKIHSTSIEYGAIFSPDVVTNITYNITCYNKAGLNSKASVTVHHNITRELNITIIQPDSHFSTGNNIQFRVNTNILSRCVIDNGTIEESMGNNLALEHSKIIKIAEGYNEIIIRCTNDDAEPKTETYIMYGNVNKPMDMQIITNPITCSLNTIKANLTVRPTTKDVVKIYYNITEVESDEVLYEKTILVEDIIASDNNVYSEITYTHRANLENGTTYKIQAYAIDAINHVSNPAEPQYITIVDPTEDICDKTPPIITIKKINTLYLDVIDAHVSCEDGSGSGCKDGFDYKQISVNGLCNATSTYNSYRPYSEEDLTITQAKKLCVRAIDNNNNYGYNETIFEIADTNYINITLIPDGTIYKIIPSRTIVTTTPIINIKINTSINANCKYSQNIDTNIDPLLLYDKSISFDISGTKEHVITNFNTQLVSNKYKQNMNIICKSDLYNSNPYSIKTIEIIYVNAAIIPTFIEAIADPNYIRDFNHRETQINITTDVDTVCNITSEDTAHPIIMLGDENEVNDYMKNHIITIKYDSDTPIPSEYTYNITCKNFADTSNKTSVDVYYDISNSFTVKMLSNEYFTGTKAEITAETSLLGKCRLYADGSDKGLMSTEPSIYHTKTLNGLATGQHTITFSCSTEVTGLEVALTQTITTGITGPINMHITTDSLTCSLNKININLSATKTDKNIAKYYYNITNITGGLLTSNNDTDGEINYIRGSNLINGTTYIIQAYAIDEVGHVSSPDSKLITIVDPNEVVCDKIPPIMTITSVPTGYIDRLEAKISCTDSGSNCTSGFKYKLIEPTELCNATSTYGLSKPYTNNITITQTKILCVIGRDNNNNPGYAEQIFEPVDNNNIGITIDAPRNIEPHTIITTTPITNIDISTNVDANCSYNMNTPTTPTITNAQLKGLYDASPEFIITGTKTHQITAFNTQSKYRQSMTVICKVNSELQPYSSVTIEIIYINPLDIPTIIASANPENITDWNHRRTELNITTNNETICKITSNDPAHSIILIGDENNADTYTKQHYETIEYGPGTSQNNYTYNIVCTNFGEKSNNTNVNVSYNISNDFNVKITSQEYFTTTTATIKAYTNLLGVCQLYINDIYNGTMSTTQSLVHSKTLTLPKNTYNIEVKCQTQNLPLEDSATQTITTGITGPTNMQINAEESTCSLTTINAKLTATPTIGATVTYKYNITEIETGKINSGTAGNDGIIAHTFVGINGNSITDGNTYKIDAYAIDSANYASNLDTFWITGRNQNHVACDKTPPTIILTEIPTGYIDVTTVKIDCSDGEIGSGCSNNIKYKIIANTEMCGNVSSTYTTTRAWSDILTVRNAGKLCVLGTDKAGNKGYNNKSIELINTNEELKIVTISPPGLIIQPNVFVTTEPITTINVTTALNADCRYNQNAPGNIELSTTYANSEPFNKTELLNHSITAFNTNSIPSQYLNIICKYRDTEQDKYGSITLEIVYINTSIIPALTVSANPSMIIDWNDRKTEINMTTDINTVCIISSTNDNQHSTIYSGDATNALTYSKHHYEKLYYDANTVSPSEFNYKISCKNLASISNNTEVNIIYNISNEFIVNMTSPNIFRTLTINVVAKTNLIATCNLFWEGIDKGEMSSNPSKNHLMTINGLTNGKKYEVEITCITDYRALETSLIQNITINTSLPDPNAVSCGDGIINGNNVCDGNTPSGLSGKTCTSGWIVTNYTGGVLKCKSDCSGYDFSSCDLGKGYCGNNRIEGPNSQGKYEQCDGSIRSSLKCKDFGFKYGSLSCTNCRVNTSMCTNSEGGIGVLGDGVYTCRVNNQLDSGEQCEIAGIYGISCESFGYDGGTVSCTSCDYVLSGCYFDKETDSSSGSTCNNNNKTEVGEECDGTSGLSTVSCKTLKNLGNFSGGNVSCTRSCKYDVSKCIVATTPAPSVNTTQITCTNGKKDLIEADIDCGGSCSISCALNKTCSNNNDCSSKKCYSGKCIVDTCNNTKFDVATESDVDCGKSCKSCAIDKKCLADKDCTSNKCNEGICSSDPCTNGEKDEEEGDVDCGGSCESCQIGNTCNLNSDCGTDNCVENICSEPVIPKNPIKLPLLIIGLVMIVGSGGYIIYKTFIEKKSMGGNFGGMGGLNNNISHNMPSMPNKPTKLTPAQEKMIQMQREAMQKKHQGRADQRKGVLNQLEESLTGDKKKEETKNKEDELKTIDVKSKDKTDEDKEFVDISKVKNKKGKTSEDPFHKLKEIGSTEKDSEKNEGSAFDKLKTLKVNEVSKQISEISGESQSTIKPALASKQEIGYSQAIKMFGNIDRDMIMSGVFKEILSKLMASEKISKEHVSNILFEYMDKKVITKSDVAKISSDLKII